MGARSQHLRRLANESFDVLVIGGGATGSGIALEAATRGLKVALVERYDFGSGTSSRSTKLVHGGVRYLEQAVRYADRSQFQLVREALKERATLLANARHLARPLPLLTPIYGALELPYYFTGLKLYDMLAGRANLRRSRLVNRDRALERFPMLRHEGLRGAVEYHDGQFDDARMNVALVLTAAEHGATVLNYAVVEELVKLDGRVRGAVVRDDLAEAYAGQERYEVRADVVINATGPFVDAVRRLDDPDAPDILKTSSGIHVVLPGRFSPPDTGLLIPRTEDGRVLFLLPWLGHTLVGTTDNAAPVEADPQASSADVAYILRHVRHYFDLPVAENDVLSAWSGLRPLVQPEGLAAAQHGGSRAAAAGSTSRLSRDHTVLVSESGLVTITGGKWTTYRKMAEDAVEVAIAEGGLAPSGPSVTASLPLVGAAGYVAGGEEALAERYGLDPDVARHLHHAYGDRAPQVAALAQGGLGARLVEGLPYLEAEVRYAREVEFAQTSDDVLERRTRLAFLDRLAAETARGRVEELLERVP